MYGSSFLFKLVFPWECPFKHVEKYEQCPFTLYVLYMKTDEYFCVSISALSLYTLCVN